MDIFDYLRKAVNRLVGVPEEEIRPESTPKELNLDLFDMQELVLDAEKEFDVILPESEFDTLEGLAKRIQAA